MIDWWNGNSGILGTGYTDPNMTNGDWWIGTSVIWVILVVIVTAAASASVVLSNQYTPMENEAIAQAKSWIRLGCFGVILAPLGPILLGLSMILAALAVIFVVFKAIRWAFSEV